MSHLGFNTHGKGRVRLVKIERGRDGTDEVIQFSVQLLLEGDNMADVFMKGDNANCVPTDTCKNTVYCVANKNNFKSPEEFGIQLCKHFLAEYPKVVNKISVQIFQDNWVRIQTPNSAGNLAPHKHTFRRYGPCRRYAHVQGSKRPGSSLSIQVQGGFQNMDILKTTQSGFEGFHKCRYTSLPEDTGRLLGTSVDCEWAYSPTWVASGRVNYAKVFSSLQDTLVNTFAGPADKGVYSPSVQETLYKMASDALAKESAIEHVTLQMPNIHNLAFPLERYGYSNKDHTGKPTIFYPIDEPHGMIKATLSRTPAAKL